MNKFIKCLLTLAIISPLSTRVFAYENGAELEFMASQTPVADDLEFILVAVCEPQFPEGTEPLASDMKIYFNDESIALIQSVIKIKENTSDIAKTTKAYLSEGENTLTIPGDGGEGEDIVLKNGQSGAEFNVDDLKYICGLAQWDN